MRDRRYELRIHSWSGDHFNVSPVGSWVPVEPGWIAILSGPTAAWFCSPNLRPPFSLLAGVGLPWETATIKFGCDPAAAALHQRLRDEMVFVDEIPTSVWSAPRTRYPLAERLFARLRYMSKRPKYF